MLHLISINCRFSHSCLAQFYVRQELERHLPEQKVLLSLLTINDPYYQSLLHLSTTPASGLLFSVYIWNHGYVQRLVQDLSRLLPDVPLVLGGPQAASLDHLPPQCSVVEGEIEAVDRQFYDDLAAGSLQSLYRAGKSHSFSSPYTTQDYQQLLNNRQLYYESSRGCPFSCSYCLSSISRGVRHKPLELVEQELAELIDARPMIIKFVDRTFNDDQGRALAIWRFLKTHAAGVKCHFEIAPDRFSPDMLEFLATVSCDAFQFEIGIQSCNSQTLAAVNRTMDVALSEEHIRRLVEFDTIHIHLDLILGLPFETAESFGRSLNRVFAMAPHYIQLGLLKVLPGTAMEKNSAEYGLVFCSEPPYEVLATRWLNHDRLSSLYFLCEVVEAFYNTRFFRSIWQYLRVVGRDPFVFFTGLCSRCLKNSFLQRAKTHKFMHRLLYEEVATFTDGRILQELLCYDWLRCGHKSLPEYCQLPSQKQLRNALRTLLPENLDNIYDYRSRVEFFKQATFLPLSRQAMAFLGFAETDGLVALLAEQTTGVMRHCKAVVLPIGSGGKLHEKTNSNQKPDKKPKYNKNS